MQQQSELQNNTVISLDKKKRKKKEILKEHMLSGKETITILKKMSENKY